MTVDLREPGAASSGRSVTSRVLSVLDAFTDQHRSLTLSEIGRRAGIPIATAHRLVGELVQWGALERAPDGRYQIGLHLWEVGALAPRGLGIRDLAMPFLEDLWAATHHHVQLAVLDGRDAVDVERFGGRDPAVRGRAGARLPAHATGAGLVLLAFAAEPVQRSYLAQRLVPLTPRTITDARLLRGTLAGVRQTGFAVSDRHTTMDAVSVAAPVRDAAGEVVAALAVVVPAPHREPVALAPAVVTAARGLSRRLSGLRKSS